MELERAERTISAKHSELRQSLLPKYYVIVNNEAGTDPSIQRVNKGTVFSFQTGDTISGYEKDGTFYTGRQILSNTTWLFVFTLGGLILVLIGLSILLRKKTYLKKIRMRIRDFLLQMPSGLRESWKYILLSIALIWLFGGYALHFFQIHFTTHQEVNAKIIEAKHDPGYGRFNTASFYLTFSYEQNGDAIIVKTKVNHEMYEAYSEGNTVNLWVKTGNPYYAYPPSEVNSSLKQLVGG